jgi:hypothetical protein
VVSDLFRTESPFNIFRIKNMEGEEDGVCVMGNGEKSDIAVKKKNRRESEGDMGEERVNGKKKKR